MANILHDGWELLAVDAAAALSYVQHSAVSVREGSQPKYYLPTCRCLA